MPLMKKHDWSVADSISDRIVDAFNTALARMRREGSMDSTQLIMGYCLAFKAMRRTMPSHLMPDSLVGVAKAIDAVMDELFILRGRPDVKFDDYPLLNVYRPTRKGRPV